MFLQVNTGNAQRQLLSAFKNLDKKQINLSITRAINSALGKTKTAAARAITSRYNLTHADVITKLRVVQASPASAASMMRGYLKAYNQPFSLSLFNPKEINQGLATTTRRGMITGGFRTKAGLRANKKLVKNGVIVEVIKGQQKVLTSAFIAVRKNSTGNFSVSAKGEYKRGFNFKDDGASKSLRGIGVASVLRSNSINSILKEYAENEYLRILYKELQKRVKGVGSQHSRY